MSSVLPSRTVSDLMHTDVVTVPPDATARQLAALLWQNGISGAPVAVGDDVVGLVSSRDVLWLGDRMADDGAVGSFVDWQGLDTTLVRDLMTPDVFAVTPDTTLEALRRFFVRTGVQRAPVLDDGRLVGIVTLTDLLGLIARRDATTG